MSIHRTPHLRTTAALSALLLALTGAVSYSVAAAPQAYAAGSTLEAEAAALSGGAVVEREHSGYTGTGYVGGFTDANKGRASVAFAVQSAHVGAGSVAVRYANGTGVTMSLSLVVNGSRVGQVGLPATGGWDSWSTVRVPVDFVKGVNAVALTFTSGDSGNVNIDNLTATTPDSDTTTPTDPTVLEAEAAALSGGAVVEREHSGYTGTGYVGGFTDANKGRASVAFAVQSAHVGAGSVTVRYANGTGVTMSLSLVVNGSRVGQVGLPATGGWDSWSTVRVPVDFVKGVNAVALTFTSADSGNVNIDNLTATTPDTDTTPTDPTDPPSSTVAYEAESAFASGGPAKATTATGYSGAGYLTGFTRTGARAIFASRAEGAGQQTLTVRYRTPGSGAASVTVGANGGGSARLSLPATSGAWKSIDTKVTLRAGLNNLSLRNESGDSGDFDLDGIDLSGTTAPAQRGATVPYTAYELENAGTNARKLSPDRTYKTVASEASGRSAVVLEKNGDYAEITLTSPADALVLRYSIPDSADGRGTDATLSLSADGTALPKLSLTSRHAWVYGDYPYNNDPAGGQAHRFFDDTRVQLDRTLPAGTTLRFVKGTGDTAASYTLDLVETESVPGALTMPDGYVSATTLGVTPDDNADDTGALNSALNQARSQGKGLWLPKGTYNISGRVLLNGVRVAGAGQWYTVLRGKDGKGGLFAQGGTSSVQDLSILGDATYRNDSAFDAGIEGDFGEGSTIQNVWIEHTKVGLWPTSPTKGLYVSGLRIRDTYADGVNLHGGVTGTVVTQSSIRNTGDDALAMWSDGQADVDNVFHHNTVQLPLLANGAAIYGGSGNRIEDNLISDTVVGAAGIAVSSRFGLPFSGTTTVARNTLTRTGGYEPNWQSKLGALWVYADQSDITTPVIITGNSILDSTYSGLLVSWQKNIADLRVSDTTIDTAGAYGMEINASGQGSFSGVTVRNAADGALNVAGGFTVQRGSGNSGW
ncbi:carbohydrate-binding protein [Streptomyces nodosus]|uniref:carbohydrate-binding protein n=2 Tax=Streptomyces TaxID=1883 RepID=UPI00380C7203